MQTYTKVMVTPHTWMGHKMQSTGGDKLVSKAHWVISWWTTVTCTCTSISNKQILRLIWNALTQHNQSCNRKENVTNNGERAIHLKKHTLEIKKYKYIGPYTCMCVRLTTFPPSSFSLHEDQFSFLKKKFLHNFQTGLANMGKKWQRIVITQMIHNTSSTPGDIEEKPY